MKFRKITVFLFLIMIFSFSFNMVAVHAATVEAVGGSTPTIDGVISAGEWTDASTVTLTLPDGTCTIYVKQDNINLYIAFHIPDNSIDSADLCAVMFDTDHDLGSWPDDDDFSFRKYRSGTESIWVSDGLNWEEYTTPIGDDLKMEATSNPTYWEAEFSIRYWILGIIRGTSGGEAMTMGICFEILEASSTYYRWPSDGGQATPSTWNEIASSDAHWVPWFTSLPMVLLLSVTLIIFLRRRSNQLQNVF